MAARQTKAIAALTFASLTTSTAVYGAADAPRQGDPTGQQTHAATRVAGAPATRPLGQLGQASAAPETPTVGEPPAKPEGTPEVEVLVDRGGVLLPSGTLVIEPSVEFDRSTVNQLNFRGVAIAEAILIGVISATNARRDAVIGALTTRYGVTSRFMLEARVPYVYRSDSSTEVVQRSAGQFSLVNNATGNDIGDIEFAGHYQLNSGQAGWPFLIANLRYKTNTGKSPYDVRRDPTGLETELATGSGFNAIEPSLTVLYPSDPAVLYLNLGYLVGFGENINKTLGPVFVGRVDPGNAVRTSFGLAYALNDRLSLSFGYQHDFIDGTESVINGIKNKAVDLSSGQLVFGLFNQFTERFSANLTTYIGATRDAPDVQVILRVPIRF